MTMKKTCIIGGRIDVPLLKVEGSDDTEHYIDKTGRVVK